MDKEVLSKYKEAGKIAIEAKKLAREKLKPGIKLLDLADEIENKIISLGEKIAFPVNLSLNEEAAHSVPSWRDTRTYEDGDIIKVDIGVHVDGYIADTAFSVSTKEEDKKLIQATEEALKEMIKLATPGTQIRELGKRAYEVITSYNLKPIVNLTGHSLGKYDLHAGISIPNYDNNDKTELEEGMAIAIEPFATDGSGFVIEGKEGEVMKLDKIIPIRNGREVIRWVSVERRKLPFAKRWIMNKFNPIRSKLAIDELIRKGVFHQYKVLREKAKGRVSQSEHTVIVAEKPIVTT